MKIWLLSAASARLNVDSPTRSRRDCSLWVSTVDIAASPTLSITATSRMAVIITLPSSPPIDLRLRSITRLPSPGHAHRLGIRLRDQVRRIEHLEVQLAGAEGGWVVLEHHAVADARSG